MAIESQSHQTELHFILFPLMAQGHMIPMFDIAKLLAQHGAFVSIITTPSNAARFTSVLDRAVESGLKIQVHQLEFSIDNTGLPKNCENIDMLTSPDMIVTFVNATSGLQKPVENLFQKLTPRPSCIISDMCLTWTLNVAKNYSLPRISFTGYGCCCMLCMHNVFASKAVDAIASESEYFEVPGLPDKIELTKALLPIPIVPYSEEIRRKIRAAESETYGVIINTFEELELEYVKKYKAEKKNKVWCIGPVCLSNKQYLDMAQRGSRASFDEHKCLNWLNSKPSGSVLYVCIGSVCVLSFSQTKELALGLEATMEPFIWVIRGGNQSAEIENWISEYKFEDRIEGRGMVVRGWAPQVLVLEHPAIGGFLTHCGWNSILESICAGVPMITWPIAGDQFFNEKLIVQVLKVGVSVAEEKKSGEMVKREGVVRAVNSLMKKDEREERRERIKQLAEMAKSAMEEGGSSYLNMKLLIQDIMQQGCSKGSAA